MTNTEQTSEDFKAIILSMMVDLSPHAKETFARSVKRMLLHYWYSNDNEFCELMHRVTSDVFQTYVRESSDRKELPEPSMPVNDASKRFWEMLKENGCAISNPYLHFKDIYVEASKIKADFLSWTNVPDDSFAKKAMKTWMEAVTNLSNCLKICQHCTL